MEELELIQRNGENGRFSTEIDRKESLVLAETSPKTLNGKRNPPARNTSRFWFERFLAVIQRQNPTVIDSSFLSQVAPNNEGKLLAHLKFLHVIDEEGKPLELLSMLNMVGAEQKKGFQRMIRESYGELVSEIVVEKAVPDDVVNFFIRQYAFTRDKAINAAKFFLYLAEKASFAVSPELSSLLTEKNSNASMQVPTSTTSVNPALPKLSVEKTPKTLRESRMNSTSVQRKSRRDIESNSSPAIQTVINITLDKDTPQEYWDRVLALIGKTKNGSAETQISQS